MENFRVTFESKEHRKLTFDYIPVMGVPVNVSHIADMIESYFKNFKADNDFSNIIYMHINRKIPMKEEFRKLFDRSHLEYISTKSEDIILDYLTTTADYKDDFIKKYLQIMHDFDYYIFTTLFENSAERIEFGKDEQK